MAKFSHYFTAPADSSHDLRKFSVSFGGVEFTFETDSNVFSRSKLDEGSRILLEAVCLMNPRGRVLDLGCGWGAIGVILLKLFPDLAIEFADINPRAVELTRRNLALNRLRATAYESDGASQASGEFDMVLLNPPIRAGKDAVHAIIGGTRAKMAESGRLVLVVRKQQGAESLARWLGESFGSVTRIARESGYHVLLCESPRRAFPHI